MLENDEFRRINTNIIPTITKIRDGCNTPHSWNEYRVNIISIKRN